MKVHVENNQKDLQIFLPGVESLANSVVTFEGYQYDEVGIHFVSSQEISALHQEYFNDPSTTDCISFPIDNSSQTETYRPLGDVFVCPEVAIAYAAKHKIDPYQELTLYVVHGLLHLMGYDDMEKGDKISMRAAERRQMRHLMALEQWLHA